MPSQYNVVGYESLSVTDTASGLTSRPNAARSYVGRVETADIRYRGDGTAPTAGEGVLLQVGDIFVLNDSEIDRTKFIRKGSTSGVIRGHYYSTEAGMFT